MQLLLLLLKPLRLMRLAPLLRIRLPLPLRLLKARRRLTALPLLPSRRSSKFFFAA
jgi:hypothetical protein